MSSCYLYGELGTCCLKVFLPLLVIVEIGIVFDELSGEIGRSNGVGKVKFIY